MSEHMLVQIQELLTKLSNDVARMGQISTDQAQNLLGMMDSLAAHVLGTKAVIAALVKTHPVAMADVEAWLAANTDPAKTNHADILAVARQLVEGGGDSADSGSAPRP